MIDTLVSILILLPFAAGLGCYLLRVEAVRTLIVVATAAPAWAGWMLRGSIIVLGFINQQRDVFAVTAEEGKINSAACNAWSER